jgi:asparagine synthase (glutamine-hydrolysing)
MPGIAGIIHKKHHKGRVADLDAMLKSMMHQPAYRTGSHVDEKTGIACGWVCRQGYFADCLPAWNEQRDICLIFYGEEFSDHSVIEQLRAHGHSFGPDNASYLVHLYEETGPKFIEKLNGWFSGIVLDLRERKMLLFNDRYGIARIHFHENDDGFYFASEAKSLLKVLPELRRLDDRSLGEFYSCGCVMQNRTLFAGISLLPPGSAWTFSTDASVRKDYYFKPATWENQRQLDAATYFERLKETWGRILPRYFRDDRVGLSLTGGVDSRMILAWAPRRAGELPCYTFGGRYRECADVRISREVADICRQPHHVIPVKEDFLNEFPALAAKTVYLSDGTMDVTGAIDLFIQKAARSIAPVRVTGTNGGEILRSLVAFKPMPVSEELFDPEFRPHFRAAAQTYAEELRGHRLSFTAFKQAPWFMGSKFILERSEVTLRMPYFDNDLVSLVYQAPPELTQNNDLSLRLIAAGNPELAAIGTDRGVAFGSIPGIRQARHLFHEFTFKAEYAYDYGMPQWLAMLDHAGGALHLERIFLGRHKFHHFRISYRDELGGYLKDMLLAPQALNRSHLRGRVLEKMVNKHVKGSRNYTLELHKVLTVELATRQLIEAA